MKPIEINKDYYLEKDRVIFTAAFHIKRGSCCANECRHCPYTKPRKKGNTQLLDKNDSTKTNGA
jgi:2-iminoacetate synthase ThiH